MATHMSSHFLICWNTISVDNNTTNIVSDCNRWLSTHTKNAVQIINHTRRFAYLVFHYK